MQTVNVTSEIYRVYPEGMRHHNANRVDGAYVPNHDAAHEDYAEIKAAVRRAFVIAGTLDCNVMVDRVTQHEPTVASADDNFDKLFFESTTETVTGTYEVRMPHFTEPSLSRYHPNNGWVVPLTIEV